MLTSIQWRLYHIVSTQGVQHSFEPGRWASGNLMQHSMGSCDGKFAHSRIGAPQATKTRKEVHTCCNAGLMTGAVEQTRRWTADGKCCAMADQWWNVRILLRTGTRVVEYRGNLFQCRRWYLGQSDPSIASGSSCRMIAGFGCTMGGKCRNAHYSQRRWLTMAIQSYLIQVCCKISIACTLLFAPLRYWHWCSKGEYGFHTQGKEMHWWLFCRGLASPTNVEDNWTTQSCFFGIFWWGFERQRWNWVVRWWRSSRQPSLTWKGPEKPFRWIRRAALKEQNTKRPGCWHWRHLRALFDQWRHVLEPISRKVAVRPDPTILEGRFSTSEAMRAVMSLGDIPANTLDLFKPGWRWSWDAGRYGTS